MKIRFKLSPQLGEKGLAVISVLVMTLFMTTWLAAQPVAQLEKQVFDAIYGLPDVLLPLFVVITQAGNVLVMLVVSALLYFANRTRMAIVLAVGIITAFTGAYLLKVLVMRPRPELLFGESLTRYGQSAGYGYPSAHAAIAVACAVALVPFATTKQRWLLFIIATLVCVSRIYLGVHAPLDVIGGIFIGLITGLLVWIVTKITVPKNEEAYAKSRK